MLYSHYLLLTLSTGTDILVYCQCQLTVNPIDTYPIATITYMDIPLSFRHVTRVIL